MPVINIKIRNKVAESPADVVVCGNSDYVLRFDFDAEWNEYTAKTARFVYGERQYTDVAFTGNECNIPVITDTFYIAVGVYAGELHTTTPALIDAKKSILCGGGTHVEPAEDIYEQILALINEELPKKQDKLTAGENIIIDENNVISSTGGGGGVGTTDHRELSHRDAAGQHTMSAITGLVDALNGKQDAGDYLDDGDLQTINADMALLYSDIEALEEEVDGKQPAGDYATAQEVDALADIVDGKQAIISDLTNIRAGSALGATALQSVPSIYATKEEVDTAIATATASKADVSDLPTKTSDLTNDSGFLTEHQSLANYSTTAQMNAAIQNAIGNAIGGAY